MVVMLVLGLCVVQIVPCPVFGTFVALVYGFFVSFLVFGMLQYAYDMHEHLYCCLTFLKSYDMFANRHIVHPSNINTKGERKNK